jgi:hypothetical protein
MQDIDLGHVASGIDRIGRARKTIERRQYTDKPGHDWRPGYGESPWHKGRLGIASLSYSEDGQKYEVSVSSREDDVLVYLREFATLDAALRNGTRVANDGPTPAERVEAWNLTYPVGQAVRYWTGAREGAGETGRTRTAAWVAEGHTAVVQVTGHGAWIALTHVDPIPETEG